jgi:glycerol-3-phosphate dehydrogenase subunit C
MCHGLRRPCAAPWFGAFMSYELESEKFWNTQALEKEERRIYDLCNGCRRCFNLCPSFTELFNRLDEERADGDVDKLNAQDLKVIGDNCFQCKLCYNHCPYTPPHNWMIDFPRLMLRDKLVKTKHQGVSLQDRFLAETDFIGRLGSWTAPIFNWLNRNRLNRVLMEKSVGIHRNWLLPKYASETFSSWMKKRPRNGTTRKSARKVALFSTCSVNYSDVETGKALARILDRNGIEVVDGYKRCCGMPALDGGDLKAALRHAEDNVKFLSEKVRAGYDIVIPGPTCSYTFKQEYPLLLKTDDARLVAGHTFDSCEYLMKLHHAGELDTRFVSKLGSVAYQLSCHLKAQNLGYKSRDLLQLAGARVQVVERCSAVDGTWGMKKEYHDLSVSLAQPLLKEVQEPAPDYVATDCPLSALRIQQGTGRQALHPVQLFAKACGL